MSLNRLDDVLRLGRHEFSERVQDAIRYPILYEAFAEVAKVFHVGVTCCSWWRGCEMTLFGDAENGRSMSTPGRFIVCERY